VWNASYEQEAEATELAAAIEQLRKKQNLRNKAQNPRQHDPEQERLQTLLRDYESVAGEPYAL